MMAVFFRTTYINLRRMSFTDLTDDIAAAGHSMQMFTLVYQTRDVPSK